MELQQARLMGIAHCLVPQQIPIDRPILLQAQQNHIPTIIQKQIPVTNPNPVMQPPPSIVQVIVPIAAPLLPAPQALIQPESPVAQIATSNIEIPVAIPAVSVPAVSVPLLQVPIIQPVILQPVRSTTSTPLPLPYLVSTQSSLTTDSSKTTSTTTVATITPSPPPAAPQAILITQSQDMFISDDPQINASTEGDPYIPDTYNNITSSSGVIDDNVSSRNETEQIIDTQETVVTETVLIENSDSITERTYSLESTEIAEDPPEELIDDETIDDNGESVVNE